MLSPLALDLFDWIVDPIRGDNIAADNSTETIQDWHAARYQFQELWPEQYMDLLD